MDVKSNYELPIKAGYGRIRNLPLGADVNRIIASVGPRFDGWEFLGEDDGVLWFDWHRNGNQMTAEKDNGVQ